MHGPHKTLGVTRNVTRDNICAAYGTLPEKHTNLNRATPSLDARFTAVAAAKARAALRALVTLRSFRAYDSYPLMPILRFVEIGT